MVEVDIKEQIQYIQKSTKISKEHTKKTVYIQNQSQRWANSKQS